MLKTESPCFQPKETVGEVPSSRLVHNIQQCQKEVILFFSDTTSQHSITPITHRIQSNTPTKSISISSENFKSTQGREIEGVPKKLEKVDKKPSNLRNSSKIEYPFHFLSKTVKSTKSHNSVK